MRPDTLLFYVVDAMLESDVRNAASRPYPSLIERLTTSRLGAWRALWWG